jgi:monovalent cation:H+ antiporter-2, CPA2 family
VLEMNPETVKEEKIKGEPIRFGDPSHHSVLVHAGVRSAKMIAVVINDPLAAMHIVKVARSLNPDIYIITRTRYFQEVANMINVGANDVIPDEFGSSLEIFTRVLQRAEMPQEGLYRYVDEIRKEGYEALGLHNRALGIQSSLSFELPEAKIETLSVNHGSPLVGKTVLESELKKAHGLTVLLIRRQNKNITQIEADTYLEVSDSVVVIGSAESLKKAKPLFQAIENVALS